MMRHARIRMVVLMIGLSWMAGGRSFGQTQVVGPGSTPQGDILRGEGIFYQGLGWFELNDAKAMALNFETWRKMEQWNLELQADMRRAYNNGITEKKYRDKRQQEAAQAKREEREMQLRTNPSATDIRKGDALNALLIDLSDPNIPPTSWQNAQVPLPVDISIKSLAMRFAPKSGAKGSESLSKGLIALGRLDMNRAWPEYIPKDILTKERLAYQEAYDAILAECLANKLDSKSVSTLDAAITKLIVQANVEVPTNRNYREKAVEVFKGLKEAAVMFNAETFAYAKEMIADTNRHQAHTVGELLAFMRKYRLMFASADKTPGGEQLYSRLYQLLREQKEKLRVGVVEQDGFEVGSMWKGTWISGDDRNIPDVPYTLFITKRDGIKFSGRSNYNAKLDVYRVECAVEGVIRDNKIEYTEVGKEKYRFHITGEIKANHLDFRYNGTGAKGVNRFGEGKMDKK